MSWLKVKDWASGVEYSTLFHSGIRAISLRPRSQRSQSNTNDVSSSPSKTGSTRRRSSVIYLSSRILRRSGTTSNSGNGSSAPFPEGGKRLRPRPSSMFVSSTKGTPDLWPQRGTNREVGDSHRERGLDPVFSDTADPFSSLPGSRSFFVHLGDIDTTPIPPKGESFLLLSSFPDVPRHRPLPKRPVSMQTTPLSYQRSSLDYRPREKILDPAWMLEESSPELKAQESGDNADISDMPLDCTNVANSDWRQFHVDWLQNEPTVQLITTD